METVEGGFEFVADIINDDVAFVNSPDISSDDYNDFALIVFIGNLSFLESAFDADQASKIESKILERLARLYQMSLTEFKQILNDYKNLMARLNFPSKNVVYGMSKLVFDKYSLYNYQDEYFKRMQVPNPLMLKRLDDIMSNFIWDWDSFFRKYKLD